MKAKKLSVRVGLGEWIEGELLTKQQSMFLGNTEGTGKGAKNNRRPLFSFQFIENEEQGHFGASKTVKLEEIGYMDRLPCPVRGNKGKESSVFCQVETEGSTRVLIVSDECAVNHNDETLVRCHLSNIRREISEEERRRAKVDSINKAVKQLLEDVDSSIIPKDRSGLSSVSSANTTSPLSQIDEGIDKANHIVPPHSLVDSEAIESELETLCDYDEGKHSCTCSV